MSKQAMVKTAMPIQNADERILNFSEVALGYTKEQAMAEATRCLDCKTKPCVAGCPVGVNIPAFIDEVAKGDFEAAFWILSRDNALPAVCGRVCPQETQCEQRCVRGVKGEPVAIGRLERFVADWQLSQEAKKHEKREMNGHKVAVVGSGPAGLTCAGELARMGYVVTVFEALHTPGGVLVYGIPEFRLPKAVVKKEVDGLQALGVSVRTNMVIGKTVMLEELTQKYDYEAVFVGSGAGLPQFLGIPGENAKGVYSANEYLTRVNLMKAYQEDSITPVHRGKKAVVIGGGNVAMDAARCARRLGAAVTVVYRRTEKELPARREEVEHAMEEGVQFSFLTSPLAIEMDDDGWAESLRCQAMVLGQPDASGRAKPVPIEGKTLTVEADTVIVSIGTSPNPLITSTTEGLKTTAKGCIMAKEATGETSLKGVFAGGDAVTGAATVILAMGAGKKAAWAIDEMIKKKAGV